MGGDRVWKCRSDRFAISVTQRTLRNLGKSESPYLDQSLTTSSCAPRALLTAGGELERKTADLITLVER